MSKIGKLSVIMIMGSLGILASCEIAGSVETGLEKAAENVAVFNEENPQIDTLTNGGVSAVILLITTLAATFGMFKKSKTAKERAEIITDIITDSENNASIEKIKSSRLRTIARDAIKG